MRQHRNGRDHKIKQIKLHDRVLAHFNKGISPGERVVTDGLQKVRDGAEVNPHIVAVEPAAASTPGTASQAPSAAATSSGRS